VFVTLGSALWLVTGKVQHLITLLVLGLTIGTCVLLHALARPQRKGRARRLSLLLVGTSLFVGVGVFGRQSFQVEGFWFYLLNGVFGGVVVHYLVAKIIGPMLMGRAWCGWGCWTWMVLDYLPYHRGPHRARSSWSRMRLLHLALSAGLVLLLWFGFGYRHGTEWKSTDGLWWFLIGNAFYYLLAVVLALALRDNRAFCKYACPVSVLLRTSSRLSLLKVGGGQMPCTGCGACSRSSPMDIDVAAWIDQGRRVPDPECTLCLSCVASCPQRGLSLSLGLDLGQRELYHPSVGSMTRLPVDSSTPHLDQRTAPPPIVCSEESLDR